MSAAQLASRLNVSRPAVSQYEKGEVDGSITLQTLRNAASALGCELVYALVPRTQLEDMLEKQARRVATQIVQRAAHSMHLEQQDVSKRETAKQIEDLTQQLLLERPRSLWDEP
jgi:predicted DNA-binding mobile mystery protein A